MGHVPLACRVSGLAAHLPSPEELPDPRQQSDGLYLHDFAAMRLQETGLDSQPQGGSEEGPEGEDPGLPMIRFMENPGRSRRFLVSRSGHVFVARGEFESGVAGRCCIQPSHAFSPGPAAGLTITGLVAPSISHFLQRLLT